MPKRDKQHRDPLAWLALIFSKIEASSKYLILKIKKILNSIKIIHKLITSNNPIDVKKSSDVFSEEKEKDDFKMFVLKKIS